jgi:hypothetical protein
MTLQDPPNEAFAAEFDLVLTEPGGLVIDAHAQAQEISPKGFRAETRARLDTGARVAFELILGDGERVRGMADLAWVKKDEWGKTVAGAKITKMSWKDSGKLKQAIYKPGFDFVALARKAFWCLYIVVCVAAIQNILLEQPMTRQLLLKLIPVVGALLMLGWSLLTLLG